MPEENNGSAPIVPAGTQKNLYGNTMAFENKGQQNSTSEALEEGETTQANQQMPDNGTTFEDLAAKKGFKSPDDLAKAYANLETSHTKKSMELSELAELRREAGNQNVASSSGQQKAKDNLVEQGYSPDEAINIVKRLIQEEVAPVKEQLAIRDTFKNPEDSQYIPAVAELVRKNPTVSWDVALRAVKYDDLAAKTARQSSDQKMATQMIKGQAQAGSQNMRVRQEVNLDQMVKDKNVPFKEIQKQMKQHFSQ